jgi:beta-glucosidase
MLNLVSTVAKPFPAALPWGAPACRLNVNWQLVRPGGDGAWCRSGMAFYDSLADRLQAHGQQLHLRLQPWHLPQALRHSGGWSRRDTAQRFVEFALGVAGLLGDRAATIAHHLPCLPVARVGQPGKVSARDACSRALALQAHHHLLRGHGLAVQALRADGGNSQLGAVLDMDAAPPPGGAWPLAQQGVHQAVNQGANQGVHQAGRVESPLPRWTLSALFKGEYPVAELAQLGGLAPQAMPGDFADIRAAMDFLIIRHHGAALASVLADLINTLEHAYPLPPHCFAEATAACPSAPWHAAPAAQPQALRLGAGRARGGLRQCAPLQRQTATVTGV